MVNVEPFTYEKVTAFKERLQMADKINEIVDVLNTIETSGLSYDEMVDYVFEQLSGYYTKEQINEILTGYYTKIQVDNKIDTLSGDISDLEDTINPVYESVQSANYNTLYDNDVLLYDVRIDITLRSMSGFGNQTQDFKLFKKAGDSINCNLTGIDSISTTTGTCGFSVSLPTLLSGQSIVGERMGSWIDDSISDTVGTYILNQFTDDIVSDSVSIYKKVGI